MTTTTTDQLVIKMSLDMAKLQDGLRKADAGIKKFAGDMQTTIGAALDLLAIKMVMSFSKDLVNNFANTGAKLEFLAQKTGESVASLDKWGTAAAKAGGSAEGFYNTIQGLQSKLQNAKFGGDPKTMGIFSYLGINPQDAKGNIKKTTDILLELSGKLKGMSRDKQQWVGQQLGIDDATLRILSQGREATEKLVKAQNALWDDKSAQRAQKAQARLIDFNRKIEKLKLDLGERLIPVMYKLTDWVTNFIDKDLPKITKAFDDWSKKTGITAGDIGKLVLALAGLSAATTVIKGLSLAFKGLGGAIGLLSGPLGAAVTAMTTLYEVYDKYQEYQKDPEEFKKNHDIIGKPLAALFGAGEKIGGAAYDFFNPTASQYQLAPKDYEKMVERLAPKVAQIESSGGYNTNSNNGAYGPYQQRVTHANRARLQAGLDKKDANWYMDPKNSYDTYKLMMMQNLKSTKGDLDKAIQMYSGGNYGIDKVLKQKIDKVNYGLLGIQQPNVPNNINKIPSANVTNNSPNTTKNNTQNITISKVEMHGVQNKEQFVNNLMGNKLVSPALAFSNGRIA